MKNSQKFSQVITIKTIDGFSFIILVRMGVYLGCGHFLVSQTFLDDPDVGCPHQTAGEGVSQEVRVDRAAYALRSCFADDPLDLSSGERPVGTAVMKNKAGFGASPVVFYIIVVCG